MTQTLWAIVLVIGLAMFLAGLHKAAEAIERDYADKRRAER